MEILEHMWVDIGCMLTALAKIPEYKEHLTMQLLWATADY